MAGAAAMLSLATLLSRILGLVREQIFAALLGAGFYGDAFTMAFRLPNLLRDLFAELFIGDYDGFIGNYGINNFYVYRFNNQKRFQMIPWDKSEAFKADAGSSIFHNLNDVPDAQRNRLMIRILSYPELYAKYLDTLQAIANSVAQGNWLESEIQREYAQIRDAARADTQKPFSNDDFENAVQGLLTFTRERSAQVRAHRRLASGLEKLAGVFLVGFGIKLGVN